MTETFRGIRIIDPTTMTSSPLANRGKQNRVVGGRRRFTPTAWGQSRMFDVISHTTSNAVGEIAASPGLLPSNPEKLRKTNTGNASGRSFFPGRWLKGMTYGKRINSENDEWSETECPRVSGR